VTGQLRSMAQLEQLLRNEGRGRRTTTGASEEAEVKPKAKATPAAAPVTKTSPQKISLPIGWG
jgi:hypothetical protein